MKVSLQFRRKGGSGRLTITLDGDRTGVEEGAAGVRAMVKEWGEEWGEVP